MQNCGETLRELRGERSQKRSLNLIQPTEKLRRGRMSARTVEKIALQRTDDREYWESRYRGYKFLRCRASYNPYNGQWYVTALMYRTMNRV